MAVPHLERGRGQVVPVDGRRRDGDHPVKVLLAVQSVTHPGGRPTGAAYKDSPI